MKHDTIPQPFSDEFNIGQSKVAAIRKEMAESEMKRCALDAFQLGYVTPEWRAMMRRRFYAAREMHDRAKAILEAMQ